MRIATIFFQIQLWSPSRIYSRLKFDQLLHCDHKTGHNYKCNHFFGHIYRIVTTLEAQMAENWHCITNFIIGTINCLSSLLSGGQTLYYLCGDNSTIFDCFCGCFNFPLFQTKDYFEFKIKLKQKYQETETGISEYF